MKPPKLPDVSPEKGSRPGLTKPGERAARNEPAHFRQAKIEENEPAHFREAKTAQRLSGQTLIGELLRNMELGQFELAFSVLLPCAFTVYLNPEDLTQLSGVLDLIADDARRALRARVAEWNQPPKSLGIRRGKAPREYKIACGDWAFEFLPDSEVPPGDVEIHSQLSESAEPGYRGMKTTLMDREPTAGMARVTSVRPAARSSDVIYAEIRYEDDSGSQVFLMTQNRLRVGRGGGEQPVDLALYASDEVSREHLMIRRDPATGVFLLTDLSTNGTWLDGKRLRKGAEEILPDRAEIGVAEVLKLSFEVRK
jgi:hypothetical protein